VRAAQLPVRAVARHEREQLELAEEGVGEHRARGELDVRGERLEARGGRLEEEAQQEWRRQRTNKAPRRESTVSSDIALLQPLASHRQPLASRL
jgi:hypothetical protein